MRIPDITSLPEILPWPFVVINEEGEVQWSNQPMLDLINCELSDVHLQKLNAIFKFDNLPDIPPVGKDKAWVGKIFPLKASALFGVMEVLIQRDPTNEKQLFLIGLENAKINGRTRFSSQSELKLLRVILDNTLDYVYVLDPEGRLILGNQSFEKALGVPYEGYEIGKTLSDLLGEEKASTLLFHVNEVVETQKPIINHVTDLTLRNRKTLWLQTTLVPALDSQGKCIAVVCVSHDISDIKETEAHLRDAIARAEAANQAKSEFLANMSHEIRTPINGIIGMTELAMDMTTNEEERSYLETVLNCSSTLLSLINDILDFSKIEAGRLHLERITFNLRQTVEEALDQFLPRVREKKLELAIRFDPLIPAYLKGDPVRVKQIIYNLVGNAIKFTEKGEIAVLVEAVDVEEDQVEIEIKVRDTGIGIPDDRQHLIFESFTQADGSTTRKYGGTGLGLTICRQLTELMGGRLWVKSEQDKGSTFGIVLPFKTSARVVEDDKVALAHLAGMRVLIVDDSETNRTIFTETCKGWGFAPRAVESGILALDTLERAHAEGNPFRLVLLDHQMPDLSGLDLLSLITNRSHLNEVKVILLSSSLSFEESERAEAMGVSRILSKPIKQAVLERVVFEVFDLELPPSLDNPPPRPQTELVEGTSLRILVAEDNPVNQELCRVRLERMGHNVKIAANGLEALTQVQTDRFDLILMDVQMPELDGFGATRRIREWERAHDTYTPIVAMTARAMRGDQELCLDAGMDGYMSKPFRVEELNRVLKKISQGEAIADEHEIVLGRMPGSYLYSMVRTEVEENIAQEDLQEFIALFIENACAEFDEIEKAFSEKNLARVQQKAHSIKGILHVFVARRATKLASELEHFARKGKIKDVEAILIELRNELQIVFNELSGVSDGLERV